MTLHLLITRPQPDAELLAARLAQCGITSLIHPMLRIEAVPHVIAGQYDGLIMTSRNAVRYAECPKHLPLFCVGEETASYAEHCGYTDIAVIAQDAATLLPRIPANGRFLYLSGADISREFPAHVERVVTYKAHSVTDASPELEKAMGCESLHGVILYSIRTAQTFHAMVEKYDWDISKMTAYCLSEAIAESCKAYPWKSIVAADAPTTDTLVAILCNF